LIQCLECDVDYHKEDREVTHGELILLADPKTMQALIDAQADADMANPWPDGDTSWHNRREAQLYWAEHARYVFGWPLVIDGEIVGEREPVAA
jgi:hypothetical protein